MNKRIYIILVFVILLMLTACSSSDPPEELLQFQQNTLNNGYWGIYFMDAGPYLFNSDGKYITSFDIICNSSINMNSFESFYVGVNYIIVYNRKNKETLFWNKSNSKLVGPSIEKVAESNPQKIFSSINNGLAASLDNVYKYSEIEQKKIKNWSIYEALYDVEKGRNLPLNYYKGDLVIFVNDSKTILQEVYMKRGIWDYMRYVEEGEFEIEIDEKDPESILKVVWWAYKNKLEPFKGQLENLQILK